MNASKTGTIDYTLDTNVTLPDETRQTSCQIICSLTQFGFREHFVHTMSPKMSKISCFPRKLTICRGNIVSVGPGPPPPPLLMGTFLGYLGQLDCHRMTAIYSLFLFLQCTNASFFVSRAYWLTLSNWKELLCSIIPLCCVLSI